MLGETALGEQGLGEGEGPAQDFSCTLAVTEGADTFAGTAQSFSGTLAVTEGADTFAGTSSLIFQDTLAAGEGADAFGAVVSNLRGDLAATEGADALAAVGSALALQLAATEGADTASVSATLTFLAALAVAEGEDTFAALGSALRLDLAATEGADQFASSTLLFELGDLNSTELRDVAQGNVALTFSGGLGAEEADDTFAGEGFTFFGALAASEAPDVCLVRIATYRRYDDLLPQSYTPLLRTFAQAMGRVQDIPVPIDTVKQPLIVTAAFLPFVAWEYSVDVWFTAWPEATKRAIAQRSLQLHQVKGTLYGISEYIRYAGGIVKGVTRPPMTVFSGPSLTRAQREAWLSSLPQVRVWLIREEGRFGPAKAFHGCQRGGLFVERSYAVPSTALSRLKRRARWVVGGVETDVPVRTFDSYYRLHLRSTEGRSVFISRPFGRRFFVPSSAWRRLVTIRPQARLSWRSPTGPTLTPISNEPERIKVAGQRGRSVFESVPIGGYFVPSTAKYRIFDRFAVHDGTRPLRNPACQFMGTGRYGFPMHTAWLRVSVPGRISPRAAGRGFFTPRTRFWLPHDGEPLRRVRRAAQSAKRLSDRVLLDIGPKPRLIAGRPFIAGTDHFVVGRP